MERNTIYNSLYLYYFFHLSALAGTTITVFNASFTKVKYLSLPYQRPTLSEIGCHQQTNKKTLTEEYGLLSLENIRIATQTQINRPLEKTFQKQKCQGTHKGGLLYHRPLNFLITKFSFVVLLLGSFSPVTKRQVLLSFPYHVGKYKIQFWYLPCQVFTHQHCITMEGLELKLGYTKDAAVWGGPLCHLPGFL